MTHMERFFHPVPALEAMAAQHGGADALRFPEADARLTFAGLLEDATDLARGLISLGVKPGEHVVMLAENRAEWIVSQMAVAAAGAVFTPLNTHSRRDDLIAVLRLSTARTVLTSGTFRSNDWMPTLRDAMRDIPQLRHIVTIGFEEPDLMSYHGLMRAGRNAGHDLPAPEPDAPAALLFTSGTTGLPKGAVLTHRAMMTDAFETAERLGIHQGDRWTSIIPLFHCAGCIMNVLGSLQNGACYVGVPAFDPTVMFDVIEKERCTALSGVPTSYLAMLDHPERAGFDLSSLRTGSCGGADCNPALLGRCAEDFPMPGLCQVYGMTETSTIVACPSADDPLRHETAGLPLPSCEVRIVEPETGREQPAGAIGEILARGPMIMSGYLDRAEDTAEVLLEGGWLRTGDLGYLRDTGHLVVAGGRLRDMIIRGGENIYPVEVENLLEEHPRVASAAVLGVPDDYYGERVAAAIQTAGEITAADLQEFCADRIARFKIPAEVYEAHELPLTPSGKIRKNVLKEWITEGRLSRL